MDILFFSIWYFLPAGIGNAAPVVAARMPLLRHWNYPFDCNVTLRGKRLFGTHKTWRGIIAGVVAGVIVVWLQQTVNDAYKFDFVASYGQGYLSHSAFTLGILFGGGALIGDAVKSLFKRQASIAAGVSWFPFDQTDYIIGGCLFAGIVETLALPVYIGIIVTWFLLHVFCAYIAYRMGLKERPI